MTASFFQPHHSALPDSARKFAARLEPFDSYWQGTRNLAKGFRQFETYYRANYLPHMPADRAARIVVLSCGPGYLVSTLVKAGYTNVTGIDADHQKVRMALDRHLPCVVASPFPYLEEHAGEFDMIVPEQELNHLSIGETVEFLKVCFTALQPGGKVLVYAINGANPLVAPEHISHNIDHLYNVTEYSLAQLLTLGGFSQIEPFACRLYVFWTRPANYPGWLITTCIEAVLRLIFRLYGTKVRILSKRIAATALRPGLALRPPGG